MFGIIRLSLWRICLLGILPALLCAEAPTAPKLRLPSGVRPTGYSADLRLVPGEDHFSGSLQIKLEIAQPTSAIWLHAKSLVFKELSLTHNGQQFPVHAEPAHHDFIAILSDTEIPKGRATLAISYTGEVSRSLTDGLFQQKQDDDWYVFSKFEPVTARRAFPCFDEPSYKTPWELTLHVPAGLKAFSNTPVDRETKEADGFKAVRFKTTKPLPSYLVALAVGPFDVVETAPIRRNHIPSRIIVPRGRQNEAAYAASITPKLVDLLENYYGIPYPYKKLDQIVVPLTTAWGAMENAGLIAYGGFLIAPKQEDSELLQRNRAHTMLHEMSHQWFGDLVTTSWWNDIWLNEAFASWISGKLLDEWKPEWGLRTEAAAATAVMNADRLTTARRIRQPIETPGDIGNAFDGITYGKGSAVIGMFENYVGPKNFQKSIRLYLKRYKWRNANAQDLLSTIDSATKRDIGPAFSTFLNQGGIPSVRIDVSCEKNQVTLHARQQRFVPVGSSADSAATWQIPLCLKWNDGAGNHDRCVLLSKPSDDFVLSEAKGCPAWLFADANAAGYYLVDYQAGERKKLLNEGIKTLQAPERASLLRDAEVMFSSGKSDAASTLTLAREFSHDPSRTIVEQTAAIVTQTGNLVPGDLRDRYARFVRKLYDARARELGWTPKAADSEDARLLRTTLLPLCAMKGEDADLQSQAAQLARAWLKDRRAVDPELVPSVLAAAAWASDRAFFNELVSAIKKTKVERERAWMISALNYFRDPAITRSALDLFFGSGIDPRELTSLLFRNRNKSNYETIWKFVQINFDRLNATLPSARGVSFAALLPLSTSGFCDAQRGSEVKSFFTPRLNNLAGGPRNLSTALEAIRLCQARMAAVEPSLVDFLHQQ
jgi:cytosol alanyl aminopeptidase